MGGAKNADASNLLKTKRGVARYDWASCNFLKVQRVRVANTAKNITNMTIVGAGVAITLSMNILETSFLIFLGAEGANT